MKTAWWVSGCAGGGTGINAESQGGVLKGKAQSETSHRVGHVTQSGGDKVLRPRALPKARRGG